MNRRSFLRVGSFFPAALLCLMHNRVDSALQKTISLNFDDGPEPAVLARLLPLLAYFNVSATFFIIGEVAVNQRSLLGQVHASGHEIENHGYQHVKFTKLLEREGPEGVRKSLARTADIILKETGRKPRFFRPPFWDYNSELGNVVSSLGYRVMKIGDPDINSLDYDDVAHKRHHSVLVDRFLHQVQDRAKNGVFNLVFVVHERMLTVDALSEIIPKLKNDGYMFTRLDAVL